MRSRLREIDASPRSALAPVNNPIHPRLATVPAIHTDLENSSVADLPAPTIGASRVDEHTFGVLGNCLNFMWQTQDRIFCYQADLENRTLGLRISFNLSVLDQNLQVRDSVEVGRFRTLGFLAGDLPMNFGYYVLDNRERSIVGSEDATVEFYRWDDAASSIVLEQRWSLADQLTDLLAERSLDTEIADQPIAQILPDHGPGYWVLALGDEETAAFVGWVSDEGRLLDVLVLEGERVENGAALDVTGYYLVTDYRIIKLGVNLSRTKLQTVWSEPYERATHVKSGTLSEFGSGSTPTLLGERDDLVAFTDNADDRVNVVVHDRQTGRKHLQQPIFESQRSANENTLVGYRDSIVAQNWYGAPPIQDDMNGLEAGLVRLDVSSDRRSVTQVWYNTNFASTATVRLATSTGLLYGTVQTGVGVLGREKYSMDFIDFRTGRRVHRVPLGSGAGSRISMLPAYIVPGGRLVQPTRNGFRVVSQ